MNTITNNLNNTNLLFTYLNNKNETKNTGIKNLANNKNILPAVLGSSLGIIGAVGICYKLHKHSNNLISLKNLNYNEKDILMLGAGSVIGGLSSGLLFDKNIENRTSKLREATSQFFGNLACPLALLTVSNKLLDKSNIKMPQITGKSKNVQMANTFIGALPKVVVTIGSLVAGMNIGNKIMNKINNKIFHQEQHRKVQPSDYLVHTDDICIAASLLLKNSSGLSAIVSKILPASFLLAGVKTGIQEK